MSSSMDRYEYSTLEVDTEAQSRNQYAETASQYPEVNHHATEHLNYPEVVSGGGVAGGLPYKPDIDRTPPEAVQVAETPAEGEKALVPPERRICGMKRKVFWGVLIGAIILIIAIVVGVTAGVVTTRKAVDAADSDSSSGSNGSAGSTSNETALYANTNIATANFTDGLGNENYLVVYQLNNKAIYMSAWNSSNKEWVVSAVVDGNTNNLGLDSVREGTALAIDVFAYDNSNRDIHVYWQLPDSGGLSTIKALSYLDAKGVTTAAVMPAANWVDSKAANTYISTAGSALISYGKQCDLCNQYTYLYFQSSDGIREASYQNDTTGWNSATSGIEVDLSGPSDNSSMAQAHAAAATTDGHRSMNIFYRSTTSGLSQIVNGDGRYVGHYLGRDVGPDTNIAAFSTGFNETSSGWSEPLGFQVLTADPDANDGVQLTYYKGSSWTKADTQVKSLSDCKARATMTANRARRIYCLVGTGDNTTIAEYEWKGGPDDTSTYSNYNKVGTVVTGV